MSLSTKMAASSVEVMVGDILSSFINYTQKPELFLSKQKKLASDFRSLTKKMYDLTKTSERPADISSVSEDALPELIIDGFDDEQIWQEIEMQNAFCTDKLTQSLARVLLRKDQLLLTTDPPHEDEEDAGGTANEQQETTASEEEVYDDSSLEPIKKAPSRKSSKPKRTSVVDDKFFKLSDMEEFLKIEDRREMKRISKKDDDETSEEEEDEEEIVDIFQEISSDDEELDENDPEKEGRKDYHYEDFFDSPDAEIETKPEDEESDIDDLEDVDDAILNTLRMRDTRNDEQDDNADDDDEGEDLDNILGGKTEQRSTFEIRQERLKRKIAELEESNLAEKPWQLLGEADATCRPENSLLQENLQFDHTQRQAPVITEETTLKLEDIIKQRIKDLAWDDVERKIKPVEQPFEYKRRIILDQEKSKQSLAEIYEKEYIQQQQQEKQEEEPPEHTHIKKMMESLFIKLDALSNFHFTPKPPAPEIRVINNLPSITVEEVAPVTATSSSLLAPGEIMSKPKREVKGTTEKEKTDRKRERRLKKLQQRDKFKNKEKKEKIMKKLGPELGRKFSKEAALKILDKRNVDINVDKDSSFKYGKTGLTSSKNFFAKLQDEVTNQVHAKKALERKRKKKANLSGVKLKL